MSNIYQLSKELIQISPNANLAAYKRDGVIYNASPIEEYITLTASNVNDNQTAVFNLDRRQLDIIPITLLATFENYEGTVTFNVLKNDDVLISCAFTGGEISKGASLPNIPIESSYTKITIHTMKACKYIFLSCKQINSLANIPQDYFL